MDSVWDVIVDYFSSIGRVSWDGIITAAIPILVFVGTLYFQNRKHKYDRGRKREVIRNILELNVKGFISAINHLIEYIEECKKEVNITVEPAIITREPLNRSNEILESLTYNRIFETLQFDKDPEMALKFTKLWESLMLYKLSVSTINTNLREYVKSYSKLRLEITKLLNSFHEKFRDYFPNLSPETQDKVDRIQREIPEYVQELHVIVPEFITPLKDVLLGVSKGDKRIRPFIDDVTRVMHIYSQINTLASENKNILDQHKKQLEFGNAFVEDFYTSFKMKNSI